MAMQMKDSGIEWIGEIPADWEVRKLRYFGHLDSSGVDKKIREGEPLFKSIHYTNVYNNSFSELGNRDDYLVVSADESKMKCKLVRGDVLFTNSSETAKDIGHSVVIKEDLSDTLFGYHLMRLRPTEKVVLEYEKYMFGNRYLKEWFGLRANGITRYGINYIDFADALILIPPIALQEKIALFLDSRCAEIDVVIAAKQRQNELLKEQRHSIVYEAVTKGLDPTVTYKDSGVDWIGEIPAGWEVRKIKYAFINLDSKRVPLSSEERDGLERIYDYYGASGVIDKIDRYIFDDELILVGEDGANLLARSTPLAFIARGKFWVNNHAHILKPIVGNNLTYMAKQLETIDYTALISGSAQPKLTQEQLENVRIVVPPTFVQQQIGDYLDIRCAELDRVVAANNAVIDKLKDYRQSLIYEAVTGKIAV